MDVILSWNAVALEANRVSFSGGPNEQPGPTLSSRALAIVHLAMYDAYASVAGNPSAPVDLRPYLSGLPGWTGGNGVGPRAAATAGAAFTTLVALYPSQRAFFELARNIELPGHATNAAYKHGEQVAMALLTNRAGDPNASDAGYKPSDAAGRHRVDPDNAGQPFHAPFYGSAARCFACTARWGLNPPPALGSAAYQSAVKQVRAKGIERDRVGEFASDERRTATEELIGVYWGYDGAVGLGTPPRLYNQFVREIAMKQGNSAEQNARLFALVNAAMADAGILAWQQKYIHDFWRPVLGIREGDKSLGPTAPGGDTLAPEADPAWLPLGAPASNSAAKNFTPPFPAYPSGHATFGAAAFQTVRRFYGVTGNGPDTLVDGLPLVSEEYNGSTKDNRGAVRPRHARAFPNGLADAIRENGESRVYLGVHWEFDAFTRTAGGDPDYSTGVGGAPLGIRIADDLANNGLYASTVTASAPITIV
jgi:vanadium chloroperoxidase